MGVSRWAQHARSRRPSWPSLGRWAGLTAAGFIVTGDFHMQTSGPTTAFDPRDIDLSGAIFGFVLGAVSGLIIGGLQWLVLKSWTPHARPWIPCTVVGLGLVHAVNDAVPYRPLPLPLMLVIGGVIVGLAQTVALRRTLARPLWWAPIAGCAWVLGFQLGFAWRTVDAVAGSPLAEKVTVHGTAGLLMGAITGVAFSLLRADTLAAATTRPAPP